MDEEVAVDNVNMNSEEKIKQKKKDKKSKKRAMAAEEAHNVDTMKSAESDRISENENISEAKRDHKSIKEKKKTKKTKGAKDDEADMKNGSRKAELTGVHGESSSGLTIDNAERKSKRRERKDKKEKSKMQDTEKVKRDDCANCQEGENVSGKESAKEVMEEKEKKVKRNDNKEGVKDGEVVETGNENCLVNNVADIMKETKKDKKKNKDGNLVGSKDTSNETKFDGVDFSSKQQEHVPQNIEHPTQRTQEDGNTKTNHDRKTKKKHKKKEKSKDDILAVQQDNVDDDDSSLLNTEESQNNEAEFTRKRRKKKTKCAENGSNDDQDNEAEYANKGKKRKNGLVVNGSDDTSPNKSSKKVRFSDHDEVFTIPTNSNNEKANGEVGDDLVRGKRFTQEEDKMVKDAVLRYIEEKDLGDEGLEMVLNCSKHSNLKGCWKEIGSGIPNRPYRAVYYRARILFMRSESRKWTKEELNMVLEYQQKNGNQWRPLADELGKHTWHVKDAWRRIKLPNRKKGNWSQQEYQRLFDLVNTDLQLKLSEEKKSKHGMLRDNICWTAISDTLSTRAQAACCLKWYKQLTSAMVAEGVWADSDDFRLLCALYGLDATCLEDVDWDDLIDNRPGEVCRKRWNQMVLHLGHNGNKSFAEQVEVLAKRYCPHLLEARVIWENKPRVP